MQDYTTIEQSKKLVELGLNPDTADMCWTNHNYGVMRSTMRVSSRTIKEYKELLTRFADLTSIDVFYPCWSLGALLELMPISIEEVKGHKVDLILGRPKDKWCLAYFDWTGLQHGHSATGDIPIEAAYNMVCWLLENGVCHPARGKPA